MIDYVTDGEKLCYFLEHRLLSTTPWEKLTSGLEYTGRAEELIIFFRQLTVVNLTGRLVIGGASLAMKQPGGSDDPNFEYDFTNFLQNTLLGIPSQLVDEIYRASVRAVRASQESISEGLKHKMRKWAVDKHSQCYICGVELNFANDTSHSAYTCEHIWPRAYGGNSIEDNLLPACSSCNSGKKRHFATWVMPAIQSLIMGFNPSSQRLEEIEGSYKFALHYKIAQQLANQKGLTMKRALVELGLWTAVRVTNQKEVADFFNLQNYQDRPHLHLHL